jgi:hypothetical protein
MEVLVKDLSQIPFDYIFTLTSGRYRHKSLRWSDMVSKKMGCDFSSNRK